MFTPITNMKLEIGIFSLGQVADEEMDMHRSLLRLLLKS